MKIVLLCLAFLALVTAAPVQDENGVWVENGVAVSCPGAIGDGYCWYQTERTGTWQDMRDSCKLAPGSDLATIENAFQSSIAARPEAGAANGDHWIGLNIIGQSVPPGNDAVSGRTHWDVSPGATWIDGKTSSFRSWTSGEPNNAGNKPEQCAHTWKNSMNWNDESCAYTKRALCRFPTNLKCGRRRFISWGDPHYTTWDGLKFDYQGRGLHTTCKNPNWEITSCHTPWRGNNAASVQRAVHIQLTQNSLILAPVNNNWIMYKDDSPISLAVNAAIFLTGGEELRRDSSDTYKITTKDGFIFTLRHRGNQYIDLRFFAYGVSGSGVEGICGSPDCNVTNDYTGRDGTVYDISTSNSWYDSARTWHTSTNPFLGIQNDFVCPTAAIDPPAPGPAPGPLPFPDCSGNLTPDEVIVCDCCKAKTNTDTGPVFEACLQDLTISNDPASDCELVPDETCSDDCLGVCENGECMCPNNANPPLCEIDCCTDKELFDRTCNAPVPNCATVEGTTTCKSGSDGHKVFFNLP